MTSPHKSPPEPRPRILLIDDDHEVLKALRKALAPLGCEVLISHDQDEALQAAREAPPAVIISDITLVASEGHDVVRRLRETGINAVVIMISGRIDNQDRIDALANGAMDCLRKPWSTPELLSMVTRALRLHAAQSKQSNQGRKEDL
jgi:two-component system KDP operon response regulator KdpE